MDWLDWALTYHINFLLNFRLTSTVTYQKKGLAKLLRSPPSTYCFRLKIFLFSLHYHSPLPFYYLPALRICERNSRDISTALLNHLFVLDLRDKPLIHEDPAIPL